MALRLLEIVLPNRHQETKDRLFESYPCAGLWDIALTDEKTLTTVLIDADRVEPLMDELSKRYDHEDGFRLVLLPVEAAAPKERVNDHKNLTEYALIRSSSRISRDELYQDVWDASGLTPVFTASVFLSTVVAAAGLMLDNAPAIIGAMVIAPLLGPNAGLALAAVLADGKLAWRSVKANFVGFTMALAMAFAIGAARPMETLSHELSLRTSAGMADMAIALASGIAGSIAFTSPVSTSLVGVMVAVALLPPTVASGMLAGAGHWREAGGAMLLVAINVTCVNLASIATFVIQGIRPQFWYDTKRARKASLIAIVWWLIVLSLLTVLVLYSWEIESAISIIGG